MVMRVLYKVQVAIMQYRVVHVKGYFLWWGGRVQESYSLGDEAAPLSGRKAMDTSVSLTRGQQGEQTVAGGGVLQ